MERQLGNWPIDFNGIFKFDEALETAINEWSCALACIISLARSQGQSLTQEKAISTLTAKIPSWKERPGALSLEQMINVMAGTLESKAHTICAEKETILKYWARSETMGGLIITSRQLNQIGQEVRMNHACRLLDCDEDELVLMNPDPLGAKITPAPWSFLQEWKGYALILE